MQSGTSVQPTLEQLMAGYLRRQAEAAEQGLASVEGGEVFPYDAGPVQPVDAKIAWDESLVALSDFGLSGQPTKAPAGWVNLVAQAEPQVAIAFCVGNFPQLVRDFHKLLQHADLPALRPSPAAATSDPKLSEWAAAASGWPQTIVALGAMRLSRDFDAADRLATQNVPAAWQSAWDNELAALAWHRGRYDDAIAQWTTQRPSLPVRFNLAMASLFSGQAKSARAGLEAVVGELPESSAWHHLARLYHTLAALRG